MPGMLPPQEFCMNTNYASACATEDPNKDGVSRDCWDTLYRHFSGMYVCMYMRIEGDMICFISTEQVLLVTLPMLQPSSSKNAHA